MKLATKSVDRKPDAEIKQVNRRVAIVRPKQPYFEWAKSVADEHGMKFTLDDLRKHSTAWLLPIGENPEEFLRREYYVIFLREISDFTGATNRWPDKRTLEKFRDWFEIEVAESVFDLGHAALKSWR